MSIVVPEYLSVALGVVEYAAIWRDWGNVRPYIFSVGWSSRQSHTEIAVVAGLTPCSSVRCRGSRRTCIKVQYFIIPCLSLSRLDELSSASTAGLLTHLWLVVDIKSPIYSIPIHKFRFRDLLKPVCRFRNCTFGRGRLLLLGFGFGRRGSERS